MRVIEMAAKGASMNLLKRGWAELPDLVGSLGLYVLGCALGGVVLVKHHYMGDEANMYKEMYTVIRSADVDDPKKLGHIYN